MFLDTNLRVPDLLGTSSPEEDKVDITETALGEQPWWLKHKHAHQLPLNIKRGETIQSKNILYTFISEFQLKIESKSMRGKKNKTLQNSFLTSQHFPCFKSHFDHVYCQKMQKQLQYYFVSCVCM